MAKSKKNKKNQIPKSNAKSWVNSRGIKMVSLEPAPMIRESGADKLYGELAVEEAQLERFQNRTLVRKYAIEFECPEFTCLCPRSGFPDFATIYIRYVPDQWCVELKALKLYINSFRNKKVFHEDVTNLILEDLVELLDPHEIEIIGDFNVRGNIHTVITSTHSK
jgi:7-cyano-7-deazaguanine reductase